MTDKMDKFIRYFDDQMSFDEKEAFEDELLLNSSLKNDYKNFESQFEKLRHEIQLEETYFDNLIYNSFNSTERPTTFFVKAAFAIPILFLIIILILPNDSSDNLNIDFDLVTLISEYSENSSLRRNLIEDEFNYPNYSFDNILLHDILYEESVVDESLFDYLNINIREKDISNNFLNQISSAEFEIIYNEIAKKTIGEQ